MLRIIQNTSTEGSKSYFSSAEYYSEGQELLGIWQGEGARRLGLQGTIQKKDWDALCDNLNPATGDTLTSRQAQERTVGYDFNFNVPKSVAALYGLTDDARIGEAFQSAVRSTMHDIESEMQTRVRMDGHNDNRLTGNMIWGEYVHLTSRPVDGIPDPNLHAHCFAFNATFDKHENRWKAGQFRDLKRDAPYFEAMFHSHLARNLADLGLPIRRDKKSWQIDGIADTALAKFSRRTAQIEAEAKALGITDDAEKDKLGAKTRERKNKELSMPELRGIWREMLNGDERIGIAKVSLQIGSPAIVEEKDAAMAAVDYAAEHWFERKSVVPERRLLATALKHSVGKASAASVFEAFKQKDFIIGEYNGRRVVTTPEILAEESRMLEFARSGRATRPAFDAAEHKFNREWLNDDQKNAVRHVLTSKDRVILIRGVAGVGKTTMMKEAAEGIEANGKGFFAFAPSTDASWGVLRGDGFKEAETVAHLLKNEKLHERLAGQVIWIDEAGQLSSKQMAQVFDLAEKVDARVILSGDRWQHGSVERGAALRLLETEAGLQPAEIKEIQRQKDDYKKAVKALSDGRTEEGFKQLDDLKWIREVNDDERYKMLAADYVDAVTAGKTSLVVSPTHSESRRTTSEIRSLLKESGKLHATEREFRVLQNTNLTVAERRDAVNYTPGDVLVFQQNARGYKKGQRLTVGQSPLPLDQAERFQVFRQQALPLAAGDTIRVTQGGRTIDESRYRLNNGGLFRIEGFTADGDIRLAGDRIISRDFGHLAHGYVVTSHASQGKSVQRVFIAQSSDSFPASSRQQFYVSVSRGKEKATVYTDDKSALLAAVRNGEDRLTATELNSLIAHRQRHVDRQRIERQLSDARPDVQPHRQRELVNERG